MTDEFIPDLDVIITEIIKYRLTCPHCMKQIKYPHSEGLYFSVQISGHSSVDCPYCNKTLAIPDEWILKGVNQ